MIYNQVIVVEGTHDMQKLNEIYPNLDVIITNGSAIDKSTLDLIKKLSETKEIICMLDPDYPGEKIRTTISNFIPSVQHVFLKKELCISKNKKKVGIEHASVSDIKIALDSIIKIKSNCKTIPICTTDLFNLEIIGDKQLRDFISDQLNIGKPNNKQFLKRINMLNLDVYDLINLKDKYNGK
ncbi:MAG: ribonuclease M5 [Anaeroplasmataceae bacterium]